MNEEIYQQWYDHQHRKLSRGRKQKGFFKPFIGLRGYQHLDGKLLLDSSWLKSVCTNSEELRLHKFLPFIRQDSRERRYRRPSQKRRFEPGESRNQKEYAHIKSRPIMYSGHHDAGIFSFYGFWLQQPYEN
ncbi:MAG TPA: hypothetical protein VD735_03180, partial [Candidatus Saccharimonadales bacterium]|nr:hypothetical protein [Candidatus Saccharimonadales bacterium]